jgi:hypothetical protein
MTTYSTTQREFTTLIGGAARAMASAVWTPTMGVMITTDLQ